MLWCLIDNLTEQQALSYIRDIFASWLYMMMEVYGRSTRDEILGSTSSFVEAWNWQLKERMSFAARWDREIELKADYVPKWKIPPQHVWQAIADVTNVTPHNVGHVLYARQLVAQCEREDFQHRF